MSAIQFLRRDIAKSRFITTKTLISAWLERNIIKKVSFGMAGKERGQKVYLSIPEEGRSQKVNYSMAG
jgi:hypothetical protein